MKHRNYEMIVAKSANTELVVFEKSLNGVKWQESNAINMFVNLHSDYFICLPQHSEACLRWLNGSKAQCSEDGIGWIPIKDSSTHGWSSGHAFMTDRYSIRIRPRKEKRWIICSPKHDDVNETLFNIKPDMNGFGKYCQLIEIEVEV